MEIRPSSGGVWRLELKKKGGCKKKKQNNKKKGGGKDLINMRKGRLSMGRGEVTGQQSGRTSTKHGARR